MSWRVLLSEYPRSLLENESAIAILALMECEGFAKEEDLRSQFAISPSDLTKILLDLQQNSLITYSRAYVQISKRGCALLDRFDLDGEITKQAITRLRLPRAKAELFAQWVAKYRAESLDEYLFTRKTAHSWTNVAKACHFAEGAPEHIAAAGAAAIWLDDLRSWLSSRHIPEETEQQKHVILMLDNIDMLPDGTALQHLTDALGYLRVFRRVSQNIHEWTTLEHERPEHFYFTCHHLSRTLLHPTLWAAEWEDKSDCLNLLSGATPNSKLVANFRSRAIHHWNKDSGDDITVQHPQSIRGALIRRSAADLLTAVLKSGTLDELEKSTKIAREPLVTLLVEISEKIGLILGQSKSSVVERPRESHNKAVNPSGGSGIF